ncbi:MAG: CDP-diacylglycerol--serine O-phosphatidyltransferase [Thermodesulfobacteriota bacterium]|nr:CDP-diacylglycerol--serine O-phosphatidyltransferase [Thermodesulfobacteriota bacterium]
MDWEKRLKKQKAPSTSRKKRIRRDNMKKGIYLLPNLFTSFNLFFGFFSIILSFNGLVVKAAYAIILASFFDLLDGRIARMTKTTSKFGLEYDSLADLVSFGLAPGVLTYIWVLKPFGRWGWLVAFLYVVCSALRLARFNIQVNTVEKKYFQGLPTPAAAGMVASTVILFDPLIINNVITNYTIFLFLMPVLALLMVSNFRYISAKQLSIEGRRPFHLLIILIFLCILIVAKYKIMLFSSFFFYSLMGPFSFLYLFYLKQKKDGFSIKNFRFQRDYISKSEEDI